jgi:outer membrane protein OmpA-like peptidoglycan-associated protein
MNTADNKIVKSFIALLAAGAILPAACMASVTEQVVCKENYTFNISLATAEKISTYVVEPREMCVSSHKLVKEQREINIFNYIREFPALQMPKNPPAKNMVSSGVALYTPVSSKNTAVEEIAPQKMSVYFDLNSPEVKDGERQKIDDFVSKLPQAASVDVIGHACWLGSEEYNIMLSKQRASNAAKYLKSKNVHIRHEEGRGENNLIDKTAPAPNRRVDIIPVVEGGDDA